MTDQIDMDELRIGQIVDFTEKTLERADARGQEWDNDVVLDILKTTESNEAYVAEAYKRITGEDLVMSDPGHQAAEEAISEAEDSYYEDLGDADSAAASES